MTDRLPSYRAAMKMIGNEAAQEFGRWLNNRAENSHQPFRRRDAAMAEFRDMKTLQKFTSVHASIHNHFNQDRHLNCRGIFKKNRSAALSSLELRRLAPRRRLLDLGRPGGLGASPSAASTMKWADFGFRRRMDRAPVQA